MFPFGNHDAYNRALYLNASRLAGPNAKQTGLRKKREPRRPYTATYTSRSYGVRSKRRLLSEVTLFRRPPPFLCALTNAPSG